MILRTVLCYVVVMKPMYFVMKIIVTKRLNKEKKSHFLLDFLVDLCSAPTSFTKDCRFYVHFTATFDMITPYFLDFLNLQVYFLYFLLVFRVFF